MKNIKNDGKISLWNLIPKLSKGFIAIVIITGSILMACNNGDKQTKNETGNKDTTKLDSAALKVMGSEVFTSTCAKCHNNPVNPKTPNAGMLAAMEPRMVLNALDNGKMKLEAGQLTEQQREAVAQFITNKVLKPTVIPKDAYTDFSFKGNGDTLYDYSGWGANLEGTGFRSAAQAGINTANVGTLKLKWAFAFPDANEIKSKAAVVGDWVIVGSPTGEVYALNKQTGKIGWHVTANSAVRSGIVIGKDGDAITAYFADFSTYTYAVDVRTGKIIWSAKAGHDAMPMNTGTLTVSGGKVFVPISSFEVVAAADSNYNCCSTSGAVAALDAKTGAEAWYHRVITDTATAKGKKKNGKPFYGPSGAPVWCSPTVDTKRGLLYIGTGENYSEPTTATSDALQAIDVNTGKVVWNFQATPNDAWNIACPVIINCPGAKGKDFDFGMAPILVKGEDGKERLLAGQKSGIVYALSPDDGKVLWKTRIGKGGMLGGIHWGMATDGKNVYAANADNIYGINNDEASIKRAPGIHAINIITGKITWSTPSPPIEGNESYLAANSAAPSVIPGIVFAGSNDGHIRAYDTNNGKILWDYNTIQKYTAVNGVQGNGGSVDCASPLITDGMLIINSGYTQFGEKSGNMLLAFEVKK